jgi:hypothetical protein
MALAREAGWASGSTEAAPLYAPQMGWLAQRVVALYRAVRRWPGMRWLGPRWMLRA